MPLTRYQIRNVHSLADPDLYRAADKDDPEALLEGVAMAGLVGVLRQLGDLAEFAAEIFHDLHEEVMATAARGHGLMDRVQQLEAEFPLIEKAFLSQTNHTSFFYNTGIDSHPNLRMDQNLITQRDLPRFVMDSYEECRGPPRLFLLDKFDVAGAGACLKRYTDPSFFKSSSSEMTDIEVQREKKTRKVKKKGLRWRNGETPDVLPASHAKLHQLLLEERVENGTTDPARRVKLKRRLNGFPFDSRTGKSYMEKLFKAPPDSKVVHEISVSSSLLQLPSNIDGESGLEILEISTVSPEKELTLRKRSPYASSNTEVTALKPSVDELNEEVNDGITETPKQDPNFVEHSIRTTFDDVVDEKEIAVDGGNKAQGSVDGYQSEDIASETDNYMDALATMDSEIETDTEYRAKHDMAILSIQELGTDTDANEELQELQARSSDAQSFVNSTASDNRNSSAEKEKLSFSCSDSLSDEGEYTPSDGEVSAKVFPSTQTYEAEIVDVLPDQHSDKDEIPAATTPNRAVSDAACIEVAEIPGYRSEFVEPSSSSCLIDVAPTLSPSNPGTSLKENSPLGPELDEISSDCDEVVSHVNIGENGTKLDNNVPCLSNASEVSSQEIDDSVSKPSDNHPEDEDPNVISITTLHFSNMSETAPEKESSENLLDDVCQTEYAEHGGSKNGVDGHHDSPNSVTSSSKEQPIDSDIPELEIFDADAKPGDIAFVGDDVISSPGDLALNRSPEVCSPKTSDFEDKQVSETMVAVPPLEINSAETCTSYSGEENLDAVLDIANGEKMGYIGTDAVRTEIPFRSRNPPDSASDIEVQLDLVDVERETVQSQVLAVACSDFSTDNGDNISSSSLRFTKLQEESFSSDGGSCETQSKIHEACLSDHHKKSSPEKDLDEQAVGSPELDSIPSTTVAYDHPKSESEIAGSSMAEDADHSSHHDSSSHHEDASTVPLSSKENGEGSESKSLQQSDPMNNSEDFTPSPDHHLGEPRVTLEQKIELNADQLDVKSPHASKDSSDSSFLLEQIRTPNKLEEERNFDVSEISQAYPTSSPSTSEALMKSETHKLEEKPMDSLSSFFPPFAILPEPTQINLEDMPPLPPLPPMQWRIAKPQHNLGFFPPILPSMDAGKPQLGEITQPPNVSSTLSDVKDDQHVNESFGGNLVQSSPFSSQGPTMVDPGVTQHDFLTSGRAQSTNPSLTLPAMYNETPGIQQPSSNPFSTENGVQDIPFTYLPRPSQETSLENENLPNSAILGREVVDPLDSSLPPPKIEGEQPHHLNLTSDGENAESSSRSDPEPAFEIEKPNGNRQLKLPRPRSPLIDAVAAHDKSKLRKVAERVRPQIAQKVEERDSLLQQIRTKSFNLKPAALTRPSIQGPKTNLRVAAILEKANAIRQALAGSDDEDDDPDSWSDS